MSEVQPPARSCIQCHIRKSGKSSCCNIASGYAAFPEELLQPTPMSEAFYYLSPGSRQRSLNVRGVTIKLVRVVLSRYIHV